MLHWRREERGTHLEHMQAPTRGLLAHYISSLLETGIGMGKAELKIGRRSWQTVSKQDA